MISPFLSKLITTRQATFTDEEIEIFELKYFLLPLQSLVDLQQKIQDKTVMEDLGYFISNSIIDHFKKKYAMDESKIVDIWTKLFDLSGFGKLEIVSLNEKEGVFQIKNNNFAKIYASKHGQQKEPVCHIIRGVLKNVYERTQGKKVECKELQCIAAGKNVCTFKTQ